MAFRTTMMLADGGLTLGLVLWVPVLGFGNEEALPTLNATFPGPRV